jgi:hypothetical protein
MRAGPNWRNPSWRNNVQAMKGKGLPGEEALKFCQDWLKKNP